MKNKVTIITTPHSDERHPYLKRFLSSYQLSNDDTIKNFDLKIDQQSRPSFSKFKMKVMPIISNDYPIIEHDESKILNLEKTSVREGEDSDLWIVDIDSRRISSSDISCFPSLTSVPTIIRT